MVNFQALFAFMRKEWIQTLRDPRTRMIVFVAPVIQLGVFGYVATLDVRHLHLGVVGGEITVEDRAFIQRLVASGVFDTWQWVPSLDKAQEALRKGEVDAVWIHRGERTLWIQGVNPQVAYAILETAPQLWIEVLTPSTGENASPHRPFAPRIFYNPEMKSAYFMLPGVALMIVLVGVAVLAVVAITRERERGTFELLQMTPLHAEEIILGKVFPYAFVGWINALGVLGLAHLLFGLPLRGSLSAVMVALALYVILTASLALWVSSFSHTQQQAMITMMGILLPMILFSGLFFPIESMPWVFQILASWNPLTHTLRILRNILLGGFPVSASVESFGILLGYGIVFGILGTRSLRRQM